MNTRLLSFLSEIECLLSLVEPVPDGETWATSRTVNYHLGLARLAINATAVAGVAGPRGSILLQNYRLADGSTCLKVGLAWTGAPAPHVNAIYAKPGIDWTFEARKVAAAWRSGPPPRQETTALAAPEPGLLATG